MKITGAVNPEILQGIKNGNTKYFASAKPSDFINIDLQDEYYIKAIKLTFWHYDSGFYTYECWVSKDDNNWDEILTGYQAKSNDTIPIMDSIRYIRLKGSNNLNSELHLINFVIL